MARRVKALSVFLAAMAAFAVFAYASPAFSAETLKPKDIWDKTKAKWNTVNSYQCKLFIWNFKTPSYIKNFPDKKKKDVKPNWSYRVFDIKFKKPDKVILQYEISKNEDLTSGTEIDKGIAYVLTFIPGTYFTYGMKDKQYVYIVFPYITDKAFNALPVPPSEKAMMKLLMIASRKEVYWKTPEDLKDERGNLLSETAIGLKMKAYEHYFTDGNVKIEKAPMPKQSDFTLNEKNGWLTQKKPAGPANVYKLTMTPKNPGKNKGITKVEGFIDPSNMMFVGLQEYEGSKLVQVILFPSLQLNPDLPDSLWNTIIKGRKLSDKKNS